MKSFYDAQINGFFYESGDIAHLKLKKYIFPVRINCSFTDKEFGGYGIGGVFFGNELDNLFFPLG